MMKCDMHKHGEQLTTVVLATAVPALADVWDTQQTATHTAKQNTNTIHCLQWTLLHDARA